VRRILFGLFVLAFALVATAHPRAGPKVGHGFKNATVSASASLARLSEDMARPGLQDTRDTRYAALNFYISGEVAPSAPDLAAWANLDGLTPERRPSTIATLLGYSHYKHKDTLTTSLSLAYVKRRADELAWNRPMEA
jgi:hypothetical protein